MKIRFCKRLLLEVYKLPFMTKENYKRKCLYEILSEFSGKKTYTIRMFFFRNKMNVLNPNDFIAYATRQRAKGGN